jgi:hypothetical protein
MIINIGVTMNPSSAEVVELFRRNRPDLFTEKPILGDPSPVSTRDEGKG